jgi:hypothetical protein
VKRRCAFVSCSATVELIIELKAPGVDEAIVREPQHSLGGHEEFGLCPASLMQIPLSEYDAEQLVEQAYAIDRILRQRAARDEDAAPVEQVKHGDWRDHVKLPEAFRRGRRPQQSGSAHWFRSSERAKNTGGTNVNEDVMPQQLIPRKPPGWLGPTGSSGETTGGTDAVTSVEDVKAKIAAAGELIAQAKQALFATEEMMSQAAQILNTVRETSASDMGAPQLIAAIEKVGEANHDLELSLDAGTAWRGSH